MWFSSTTNLSMTINVSYATSFDGSNWFVYSKSPVLRVGPSGSFDSRWIVNPNVIVVNNEYRMYYQGYTGTISEIGLATSTDGIKWTKYSGNPVMRVAPGTWESSIVGTPKVYFDGSNYKMLYTGYNGVYAIGLATSTDGIGWTKHPQNPVLRPGGPGSWDANSVTEAGFFVANGRYYMLYGAGPSTPIGLATSPDGITWTKFARNPVFHPKAGTWENKIEYGSVLLKDNVVHFWYGGNSLGDIWQVGHATSPFTPELFDGAAANSPGSFQTGYSLHQAYPNPFNPETQIVYSLPVAGRVVITFLDALGREVETLVDQDQRAGSHVANWNASEYAAGVYFYRMNAGNFVETKKVTLLK
jgi:predicted GH43/DUF377 family glycosyl hydrolase